MLRILKHLFPAFLILGLLPSCEQNISVDLGDYEPQIVVYSILTPNNPPEVFLTESIQYFAFENDNRQFHYLLNAQVELSDGVQTEVLQLGTKKVPYTYGFDETEIEDSLTIYYYGGTMAIEIGKTYTLRINDKGRVATAVTTIPAPPVIEEGYFEKRHEEFFGFVDTTYIIGAYIQDQPGNNWYRLAYRHVVELILDSDTVLEHRAPVSRNYTDATQRRNGRVYVEHTINFLRWNEEYISNEHDITLRVHNVHPQFKEFFESLREQRSSEGNPFTEPVQVRSNISGGLGIFSSYSSSAPFLYKLYL